MDKKELTPLALEIAKKTIGYDLVPCKKEDMGKMLSELLSKCLHKKVKISGTPLKTDLIVEVEEDIELLNNNNL